MANDLTYGQIYTIANAINQQATGNTALAVVDTSSFVTVGQTVLSTGYDNVMNSISQVLARTIFSIRPYEAKFKAMFYDEQRWGNHVRKLQTVDLPLVNDDRVPLTDGTSPDMYAIRKPQVLQTNFYGQESFSDYYTVFTTQLDTAFSNPEELARFWTMITTNMSDRLEQTRESLARATIANFIGGKNSANNGVIKLLTEYNTETGLELTATTVKQPENYPAFVQWVYGRIAALASMLTERTEMYQIQITGKTINRHTPYRNMRVYLTAQDQYSIGARVLADIYHDNYLRMAQTGTVNFWQSAQTPTSITVTPSVLQADGTVEKAAEQAVDNIFGVIFDEEAIGISLMNQRLYNTPLNARGGYYNVWYHETRKYWNDFTEKGIVLLLE